MEKELEGKTLTIVCDKCNRSLWVVEFLGKYGTRFKTNEFPFPGVPPYSDYWDKKGTSTRYDCPFCEKQYFTLVQDDKTGKRIAKTKTLELG